MRKSSTSPILLRISIQTVDHHITAFEVAEGRELRDRRGFAMISPGMADGFRVDIHGNIFTSSQDSVQVYASDGSHLGKILVPEKVGNLTFGGPGYDRLFIAASSSLYSIDLNTNGRATTVGELSVVSLELSGKTGDIYGRAPGPLH